MTPSAEAVVSLAPVAVQLDVNNDGVWTSLDALVIVNAMAAGTSVEQFPSADLNHDAVLSDADVASVFAEIERLSTLPQASSLPQPDGSAGSSNYADFGFGSEEQRRYWCALRYPTADADTGICSHFGSGSSAPTSPSGPSGPSGTTGSSPPGGVTSASVPSSSSGPQGPSGSTAPSGPSIGSGTSGLTGSTSTTGGDDNTTGSSGPMGPMGPGDPRNTPGVSGTTSESSPTAPAPFSLTAYFGSSGASAPANESIVYEGDRLSIAGQLHGGGFSDAPPVKVSLDANFNDSVTDAGESSILNFQYGLWTRYFGKSWLIEDDGPIGGNGTASDRLTAEIRFSGSTTTMTAQVLNVAPRFTQPPILSWSHTEDGILVGSATARFVDPGISDAQTLRMNGEDIDANHSTLQTWRHNPSDCVGN